MHSLRITVIQDAPEPRNPAANLARIIEQLRRGDADLVVFPELFVTGYQTGGLPELALSPNDPLIRTVAAACRETSTAVLAGFIEPANHGFYDAYLAIDRDGTIHDPIRKTHLFGNERAAFLPGDHLAPVTLCGTKIGVINCFELEFPEVARTHVLRGAELLIAGSANMHPYELDHRIAATARALENRVPLAYANRVGKESGHHFCGSSRVISANGETLAALGTAESAEISATVDTGRATSGPTNMLAQRRPELYA
ncbi:nitrilase-related carbon-nitrogen hydrolase [Leucobacter luti]|uniref:Putative amidohydrolase n=1 Tax=Leucobacter luti TaxID=340320 RepID=A0A4Q7TXB1_9MICO|nr:nitrilase-related carbon-nitrogen hydrolase [Leucobacter luti]MBL3698374.1 carbon-nitrogen hydrolase [Leucobacter luti]RZT64538.1 putative amidohydrolase [Leucobacter luti]